MNCSFIQLHSWGGSARSLRPARKFLPDSGWLACGLLLGAPLAPAGTFGWKNPPVSGVFNSAGSWLNAFGNGGFPGAGDDAIFIGGTYTVTCDGSASGLTSVIGSITFQLDGGYNVGTWSQGGNPVVLRGGGTLQGGPFTIANEGSILVDGSGLIMNGFDFGTSAIQTRLTATNGARITSSGQVNGPGNLLPRPRLESNSTWQHTGALHTGRCFVCGGSLLQADALTVGPAELDGGRLQAGHLTGTGLAKNGSSIRAGTASLGPWLLEGGGSSMVVDGLINSAPNTVNADILLKAGALLTAGAIADTAWYNVDGSGSRLTVTGDLSASGSQKVTLQNQGGGSARTLTRTSLTVKDPGSLFTFATLAEDSTLTIQNGGRVNGVFLRGPMSPARLAGCSVTGQGSALVLDDNLELGAFGQASLDISNGGRVDCASGFLNGGQAGGSNSNSVHGAGSFWLARRGLVVGDDLGLTILNLGDGGRVEVQGIAMAVGLEAASEGRMEVDGGASTTPSALDTRLVQETGIGVDGKGITRVRNKGRFLSSKLTVGVNPGSDGTLEVIGSGTSLEAGGPLEIGQAGVGRMTIFSGGVATAPDVVIGSNGGTNLLRLTGTGSTLTIATSLHVGETGAGQLSLEQGTRVLLSGPPKTVRASVGHSPGSNGTVTVSGAGATFSGGEGLLIVGEQGQGTLNVTNGGEVDFGAMAIGGGPGAAGVAVISGAGSVLRSPDLISIGGSSSTLTGPGEVTVSAGGLLQPRFKLRVLKPGTLRLTGGSAIVGQTSDPALPGTVIVGNLGKFNLGGRLIGSVLVKPGGTLLPGASPGKSTIEGNVTLATGTALELELGGTTAGVGYDQIEATGIVTLAGHLDIVFRDGFAPTNGQAFDLIEGSSVTGNFADVSVRGLAPGFAYTLSTPGGNTLRLTATSSGMAATHPELSLTRLTNGDVVVSWPDYISGWALQRSTGLTSGSWQAIPAPNNSHTVTAAAGASFFRLAFP